VLGLLRILLYTGTAAVPVAAAFPLIMDTFFVLSVKGCVEAPQETPTHVFKKFCENFRLDPSVVYFIPVNVSNWHWFWVGIRFPAQGHGELAVCCPLDDEKSKSSPTSARTTGYWDYIKVLKVYVTSLSS
jgi:hypothetical protein